jgi:hypothetical protein
MIASEWTRGEKDHGIAEVKSVRVGDINIAYRIQGQGDPIVLVHGVVRGSRAGHSIP